MRQADLTARDPDLYTRTGLIAMAARNAAVKAAPQTQDRLNLRDRNTIMRAAISSGRAT